MRLDPSTPLAPTTVHIECRVAGCGWAVDLPIVYRLELAPPTPGRRYPGGSAVRLELDVDATLELEAPLRTHLDEHAMNTENAALVWTPGDPVGERSTLGVLDPSIGTPRSPYTVAGDW